MDVVDRFVDLTMGEVLELNSSEALPGAGAAAAATIALAASLTAKVARCSSSWDDGAGVAAQAVELWSRCPEFAREDSDAWQEAVKAMAAPGAGDARLARLLERAADIPVEIAETGADVASLALVSARLGATELRAEAVAAAVLAHAGVRVAAYLVAINLATRPEDLQLARANRAEQAAAQAASAALEVEH